VNEKGQGAVLVTGAGHRIGQAIAVFLSQNGHPTAIHYNQSKEAAEATAKNINQLGGKAVAVKANLLKETETAGLVEWANDAIGEEISILVNNASRFEHDRAPSVSKESWELNLQTNLRAPFVLSQNLARQIKPGNSGCIVNILDQRVWRLTGDFTSYTLSKSALWTLTRTLALALAPDVRVNAVGPGPTLASIHQSEETFAEEVRLLPLQRGPSLGEIAACVKFLIDSPSMTGQMIALDGGQHLGAASAAPMKEGDAMEGEG
jgi:NAD(P)-dependent dehydrogenase (short-subunit alcohol dehydrogenase family)